MKKQTIIALKFLLVMTIITGIIYPVVMTAIAQVLYPSKSNGSLLIKDGKIIGSELIGQKFDSSIYFWSRPSSIGYNPIPSSGTNYGPTSDTLRKQVNARRLSFASANFLPTGTVIPKEMVFASASGLDPHISPEAAAMQVNRVIKARNFNDSQKETVLKTIKNLTEGPQFFYLGETRINVLSLNLELDRIGGSKQ
jgi:potassium-transporting ATPase KdpC subunit